MVLNDHSQSGQAVFPFILRKGRRTFLSSKYTSKYTACVIKNKEETETFKNRKKSSFHLLKKIFEPWDKPKQGKKQDQ